MLTPRLFGGAGDGLLLAGSTYLDDGEAYDALGKSNRVAPAGTGGECIFTSLYVTVTTYASDTRLVVTPYVDGVALAAQIINVPGVASSQGEVNVFELGLSIPYVVAMVERLRYYPRGTWLQVLVNTDSGNVALAAQLVNSIEAEYEVVRETKVAVS